MGELSDRFGELMARMAKGDADLFRTVGEQNTAIRQLVDEITPAQSEPALKAMAPSGVPQPLLPAEQCHPVALKARFRTAAAAHAHLEATLGPAPTRKKTWDHLSTVFARGAWPAPARGLSRSGAGRDGASEESLALLEARLMRRIDQLEERVMGLIESVLLGKS